MKKYDRNHIYVIVAICYNNNTYYFKCHYTLLVLPWQMHISRLSRFAGRSCNLLQNIHHGQFTE